MRSGSTRGHSRRRTTRASVSMALVVALAGGLAACDDASPTPAPTVSQLETLTEALHGGTRSERIAAADALAGLGDTDGIPALATALADDSWDVRWRAAEALVILHDERAVGPLLALIATAPASPAVPEDDLATAGDAYQAAIKALGAIGDPRAVARLVEIASVKEWTLDSGTAEDALTAIGRAAIPGVTDALAAADGPTGARIVALLGTLGDEALPQLAGVLRDPRAEVRIAAAEALAEFGTGAVEPLLGALGHSDRKLRSAAARSLGAIGDTRATKPIVALLADSRTSTAATAALVTLHRDDPAPLVPYLKARKTVSVYRALIRIGDDSTVGALVKALKAFGTKTMGEAYLNCGNDKLEQAAHDWAAAHGYTVVTSPGSGAETWGGG